MDAWNSFKSAASALTLGGDSNLAQILAAKKALTALGGNSDNLVKLCLAAANGDNVIVKDLLSEDSHILNAYDKSGLTPLIYAVCFNKTDIVELLLNFNVDCDEPDKLFTWTPIMWATYLNSIPIVTLLLNNNADPYLRCSNTSKSAVDLALPGSEMYEYFLDHNIVKPASVEPVDDDPSSMAGAQSNEDQELEARIKLQTAGVAALNLVDNSEDQIYKSATFGGMAGFNDNLVLNSSAAIGEPFDFDKVLSAQCIKFHDANITPLLDYIFSLYEKYQHRTTLPAAVVYQCLRYADHKLESKSLCENFLTLFLTRVRSITNTKSGVPSVANAQGDIVMLSYWLSAIGFLYYYLYRDTACQFYQKYPKLLQEIINTKQTLVAQLSFSINNRLDPLIDPCFLNYTSLPDSKNVSFQKEWHFFKKKYLNSKATYDDILHMLYPPSPQEQMKPSPIKVTQTLGALMYVLKLHNVDDLTRMQTLSAVLYWLGTSLFDRIIASKSYQSRTRAIQIRLNISVVEDWLRSNDFKPDIVDESLLKDTAFPDKLTIMKLTNAARYTDDINNPQDLKFYFNSLFKIGKHHLMAVVELLQWLQVMTSLNDEESFSHTVSNFIMLNPVQLYKSVKTYKYEMGESKFPKELTTQLKTLVESKKYNVPKNNYYTTADKQEHLFFNPDIVFPVALPNLQQLLRTYGGEISGHTDSYSRQFAPFLPLEVIDDVDDIYDQAQNHDFNDNENIRSGDEENEEDDEEDNTGKQGDDSFKGDQLFKEVQMPSSMAHKTWGDMEENPW